MGMLHEMKSEYQPAELSYRSALQQIPGHTISLERLGKLISLGVVTIYEVSKPHRYLQSCSVSIVPSIAPAIVLKLFALTQVVYIFDIVKLFQRQCNASSKLSRQIHRTALRGTCLDDATWPQRR